MKLVTLIGKLIINTKLCHVSIICQHAADAA